MNSTEIRTAFINFFEANGHQSVPPSSVGQFEDPSLLFTNAGMNQFKPIFLGDEIDFKYDRVVNSQPCIRVSGKHNDLEDVGYDDTHLTSFEMLGNWSFGDYYKKDTICMAWEFVTQILALDPSRLYVSVYLDDDEAFDIWKNETSINANHIQRHGAKDNFWEMGETGPCGPCSEIHYDLGLDLFPHLKHEDEGKGVNTDSGRYVELWNLVFIQYNRMAGGELVDLPKKHVDTGAGLERLAAIKNGTYSNYQTDVLWPIIQKISQLSGHDYDSGEAGVPHRVIADHLRTICWTVGEHIVPSNEGRGYVVRRLLRRALRYGKKLGLDTPFLFDLVAEFAAIMKDPYPHIADNQAFIEQVVLAEEKAFLKTLAQGLSLLTDIVNRTKSQGLDKLSGEDGFKLFDTYGFPLDLTALIAKEQGLDLDTGAVEQLMQEQRNRSRKATGFHDASQQDVASQGPVIDESLHAGVYRLKPGGGESKIAQTKNESIEMARHHSVTHLLHAGLEKELGDHVKQSGSMVDPRYLRFDFTHFQKVDDVTIERIQNQVNQWIRDDIGVTVNEMPLAEAKRMGVKAQFGEKYGDSVRVVEMGTVSHELCGGTHVRSTAQIEAFRIVSESAVATGVRRIEALAGQAAVDRYDEDKRLKWVAKCQTKCQALMDQYGQSVVTEELTDALEGVARFSYEELLNLEKKLIATSKVLQKKQAKKSSSIASDYCVKLEQHIIELASNDRQLLTTVLEGIDAKTIKLILDQITDQYPRLIGVVAGESNGKTSVLVKLGNQNVASLDASHLLTRILNVTGGRGGGKKDMAQGGNLDLEKCDEAFQVLKDTLDT